MQFGLPCFDRKHEKTDLLNLDFFKVFFGITQVIHLFIIRVLITWVPSIQQSENGKTHSISRTLIYFILNFTA